MVDKTISMVNTRPSTITTDAGYWNTKSLCQLQLQGIEMLVSPDGAKSIAGKRAQGIPQNTMAQAMRSALSEKASGQYTGFARQLLNRCLLLSKNIDFSGGSLFADLKTSKLNGS